MDHSDRSFPFRIGISDISWWSLSSLIDKTTGRQVCQRCGDEGINSYTQTLDSILK